MVTVCDEAVASRILLHPGVASERTARRSRRLLRETGVTENESGCATTQARMAELLVL